MLLLRGGLYTRGNRHHVSIISPVPVSVPVSVSETIFETASMVGFSVVDESGIPSREIKSASLAEVDLNRMLRHNEHS